MGAPQSALNWEGQTLLDRTGEKVGTIEEIFLVEETGSPEWALVKLGRLRSHTTLVPLTSAEPVDDGIKVGYEKDVVSDAPQIEADKEPSEQEVDAVYRHYGIDLGGGSSNGSANGASNGAPERSHGDLRDEPIGDVVKQVSAETKTLVGKEVKLAKTEMAEKAKEVGIGAGLFGGGAYLLNLVAIGLMLTAIFALATAMEAWLAALIVTVVLLALAGALALTGKKRIEKAGPPIPEQTIESVKQTIETVKEEAKWGLNQTR
jgi:uncharacterized membrane protein YqjE